jgi:hypothetical protein
MDTDIEKYESIGYLLRNIKNGNDYHNTFNAILEKFESLIKKNSFLNGEVNCDLKSELYVAFIKCINKFSIDEKYYLELLKIFYNNINSSN